MPDRRYDEKEVSALIKRAGELQAQEADLGPDQPTLVQVQQAASELGIQSEFLERAAAELNNSPKGKGLFGSPLRNHQSVTLRGRLTADRWPLTLQRMREATGRVGTPTQIGDACEWISHHPDGLHVSITPDGNITRVSIQSEISGWAVPYLSLSLLFLVALTAGMVSALGSIGWVLALAAYALVFLGGRRALSQIAYRRSVLIDQLLKTIESELNVASEPLVTSPFRSESELQDVKPGRT
jgi:hypothetical protein